MLMMLALACDWHSYWLLPDTVADTSAGIDLDNGTGIGSGTEDGYDHAIDTDTDSGTGSDPDNGTGKRTRKCRALSRASALSRVHLGHFPFFVPVILVLN